MKVTRLVSENSKSRKVLVYIDDVPIFSVITDHLVDLNLYVGKDLTQKDLDKLKQDEQYLYWYSRSIGFIGRRPRTKKEIRDYLTINKVSENSIEKIIAKLEEKKFLDDREFILWWIRKNNLGNPKGIIALKYELKHKGLDSELISEIIENSDIDEEEDAYLLAKKKMDLKSGKSDIEKKKNISDFLARRGYSWSIIEKVYKRIFK